MGEMIQFKRPDGKTCPGYLATPKTGSSAPGFVVIQEWWGLNDQIEKTADRLAEAGYRALVPDFYRGKVTTAADEANQLMTNLNFPDAAGQDIRGAVQYLKQSSKNVAVGGFCMGWGTDYPVGCPGAGDGRRRLLLWHSVPRRRRFEEN
jgi:carboxymethylenebutenolidase